MNRKQLLLPFILLCVLFACNDNPKSPAENGQNPPNQSSQTDTLSLKNLDKLRILYNVFNGPDVDSLVNTADMGREVAMDSALQCTGIYESEMFRHGIELNGGRVRPLGNVTTRRITKSETFAGKPFVDYITKIVRLLDPEGRGINIEFQLHMGIYTDKFLETYFRDSEAMRRDKKGRMTIFVIPVARGSFKFNKDNEDDITAFELGGLQP